MKNKNGRSVELGKQWGGEKGARIGKEREQAIIAWLARWRYSTAEVLALVLSKDTVTTTKATSDKLAKMIRQQLVRKVDCIFTNKGYVYQLTQLGIEYYSRLSSRKLPPRLDASKIRSNSQAPHDLGVQLYVAHKYRKGDVSSFMTTTEVKRAYPSSTVATPDALIVSGNGTRTAIEFEPNQKSEKRMRGKWIDNRHDQSTRDKLDLGVFDKHHNAMAKWIDNKDSYWEYVEYIMLGEKAAKTYQNWLRAYYNIKLKKGSDRSGWIDSYSFNTQAGKMIEKFIYFAVSPEDNVSTLL